MRSLLLITMLLYNCYLNGQITEALPMPAATPASIYHTFLTLGPLQSIDPSPPRHQPQVNRSSASDTQVKIKSCNQTCGASSSSGALSIEFQSKHSMLFRLEKRKGGKGSHGSKGGAENDLIPRHLTVPQIVGIALLGALVGGILLYAFMEVGCPCPTKCLRERRSRSRDGGNETIGG